MRAAALILTVGLGFGSMATAASAASAAPASWSPQPSITAPDAATGDGFGSRVVISTSGTTAFASAYLKELDGKDEVGAVYVFVKSGGAWTFQAELTASDRAEGDGFGAAISTTKDGSSVVIGAPFKTVAGKSEAGAAYVFSRSGTTWTQQAELTGTPSGRGNGFGSEVAINGIATYLAVSAPVRSAAGQRRAGAVYVFHRVRTTWPQAAFLTEPTPSANDYFGWALAVKESQVLVSSPFHTNQNGSTGAVYSFENPGGGSYVLHATLTATNGQPGDGFGWALSESVATLVVTARNHVSAHGVGAVYVFTHSDKTEIWTPRGAILPPDGASDDDFGESVSISNGTIAIGDPYHGDDQGAVYVFTGANKTWTQQAELIAPEGSGFAEFGNAVAASVATVMVGDPLHDVGGASGAGQVDVFAGS
jgi:hypothetical protein